MGAIDPKNTALVPGTCIKCQACVRKCTKHAKYFDDPAFLSHVAMLEANFTEPKENQLFCKKVGESEARTLRKWLRRSGYVLVILAASNLPGGTACRR